MKKKKIEGFGRGLYKALARLDKIGKSEADWFFGADLKRNPYEAPEGFDRAADEFFGFAKKRKKEVTIKVEI